MSFAFGWSCRAGRTTNVSACLLVASRAGAWRWHLPPTAPSCNKASRGRMPKRCILFLGSWSSAMSSFGLDQVVLRPRTERVGFARRGRTGPRPRMSRRSRPPQPLPLPSPHLTSPIPLPSSSLVHLFALFPLPLLRPSLLPPSGHVCLQCARAGDPQVA